MNERMNNELSILAEKKNVFDTGNNIPVLVDVTKHPVTEILDYYKYPVNTWPVLISREMATQLNKLATRIPRLLQAIPSLYFNNDIKKIAGFYFDGDETQAQLAMMCHEKNIRAGCRIDLTYTGEFFKILEVNMGTSIGGWQIQNFEPVIRQYHPELSGSDTAHHYRAIDTQRVYAAFLVNQALPFLEKGTNTVNIFINLVGSNNDPGFQQKGAAFFDQLLKEELAKRGLEGGVFTGDISKITVQNGNLVLDNRVIHGLIVFGMISAAVTPNIFRAFIMDKVYFPDHIGLPLLGDKRNLGILVELALAGKFSPADNQLVLDHVPWTTFFEPKMVHYNGREYDIVELMEKQKDNFVIKQARGFQGMDVFVGRNVSTEEWQKVVQQALKEKRFIAQEFCNALNFQAPNRNNTWVPHKLIWGAFGFGDHYGGVEVRMSEASNGAGVINMATGAVESLVYEIVE
ncbi:MAG: hypothetical protein JNM68_07660 [Dinghuibacter sp.]|nr:hypothetical protein [Dinghuibacter sp.]